MHDADEIRLAGLDLPSRIGVPDAERAQWQSLRADIVLKPRLSFAEMGDNLTRTVDYATAAVRAREIAAERPRHLIETLAQELAARLLEEFDVLEASAEVHKRVLPGCTNVSVRAVRRKNAHSGCH